MSHTPVLTPGPGVSLLADFNERTDGELISTQYAGVTFSQELGGSPRIDNYPWLYGYGSVSGGVLTGSTEGGYTFPTIAGIVATFASPVSAVQFFFSDTAPLGNYPVRAFGAGGVLLEQFSLLASQILPPGYNGEFWPLPGTYPYPGIFVGFSRASDDIWSIQIGPSSAPNDSFALDDLLVARSVPPAVVPEPATVLLLGTVVGLLALVRRRR